MAAGSARWVTMGYMPSSSLATPAATARIPAPTLSIPAAVLHGWTSRGTTLTVPIMIDDPHPPGSSGLTQALLALTYDPRVWSVSANDVQLGSVPVSGTGWTLQSAINAVSGQIG